MRRGEVWWYEPPTTKPRPHLIVTRDPLIGTLSDLLALPATRTRRGIPTEVEVGPEEGMPAPSVLTADNLTLIEAAYLTRFITSLDEVTMAEVCEAIRVATGC